jgi:hypothetical protein
LEDRTLPSTTTWINPAGGDWDTGSNWSTGQSPGVNDDVIINTTGITVTHSSSVPIHALTLVNATVQGPGTLTVNGSLSWTNATLSGGGSLTGTSGAAVATGNTIHFDLCDLNMVQITPNPGVRWSMDGVGSESADIVALPDSSHMLNITGPSGTTSPTFNVSSSSGLSTTQLPQGSPLVTLALVPCVPVVGPITAPLTPVPVNTAVAASASFTDPDARETHTAVWSWGDGSTSAGTVTESNGAGTVSGSHNYAADGVYTVTLTVTDNHGASGSSSFSYVVVYNPSAGFTGGGWFNSPGGAYAANPSLAGKVNFGFNAKYHSGATVPTGDTEFQFPAANALFAAGLVRGQVDLLSVVAHELGHVLGLAYEGGDGIMAGSLAAGVRLQPQASDLLGPQAASGTATGPCVSRAPPVAFSPAAPAVVHGLWGSETVAFFPVNASAAVGRALWGVALPDPGPALSDLQPVASPFPSVLLPGTNGAGLPAGLPGGVSLPPGSDPLAPGRVTEWAARSAFGVRAASPGSDQVGGGAAPSADAMGSGDDGLTWEDEAAGVDPFFSRRDEE